MYLTRPWQRGGAAGAIILPDKPRLRGIPAFGPNALKPKRTLATLLLPLGGRLSVPAQGPALAVAWMSGSGMARDRDVEAFGERAQRYDAGWPGRMHHQIADRTVDLALTCMPAPRRILDVGCGTGYLLGWLAVRAPQAEALAGIDAAPAMIEVAGDAAADDRLRFVVGTAERLPWPAASFDLVVSTTSFDHWADQRVGLAQCARVLAPGGCLVLADLFSVLLLPTLLAGRQGKARTKRRATQLLMAAGLRSPQWHPSTPSSSRQ
jgi:ubiquinone/menaquinone biosynthesis C-methylase UbiE